MNQDPPLWTPAPARAASSQLARFIDALRRDGIGLPESSDAEAFAALHAWSVEQPAEFWAAVWRDGGVIADRQRDGTEWDAVLVGGDRMAPPVPVEGPSWFTGARLNFAENLLRLDGDAPALIAWDEGGRRGLRWRGLDLLAPGEDEEEEQRRAERGSNTEDWWATSSHHAASPLDGEEWKTTAPRYNA